MAVEDLVFANFAEAVLLNGITDAATTLAVSESAAWPMPSPIGTQYAVATIFDGKNAPEIVHITANDGNGNLTVVRARESSSARSWPAGSRVRQGLTKAQLELLRTVSAGSSYDTVAAVQAANVPAAVSAIRTAGYAAGGDGGHGLYTRVGAAPAHPAKVQSADGAWWELVPDNGEINVRQLGAKGDNVANDVTAFQNTVDAAQAMGCRMRIPSGTYRVGLGAAAATTAVYITGGPCHIVGDGQEETIVRLANGADAHVFHFDNVAKASLRDLTIDGNSANQTLGVHAVSARDVTDALFRELTVHNTKAYGIGVQNGSNQRVRIENIRGYLTGFNVIDVKNKDDTNHSVTIAGIFAESWGQNTAESAKAAVTLRGRGTIDRVYCRNFGGAGTSAVTGVRLREGEAVDTNGIGAHYSVATNINVEGSSKSGTIGVEVLARHCAVSGVTVSGLAEGVRVAQRANALSALAIYDCTKGINLIDLALASPPDYNVFTGVTIRTATTGIEVEGDRNIFTGFTIEGAATNCVNVEAGSLYNDFEQGLVFNSGTFVDNGTDTRIQSVRGVITEAQLVTPSVTMDVLGAHTVTVAHGLSFTPTGDNVMACPQQDFSGAGWSAGVWTFKVVEVTSTNISILCRVETAAAAGAKLKFNVRVKMKNGTRS